MSLKFLRQDEINEGHQNIFRYLFLTEDVPNIVNDFLDVFLHSEDFKNDCLPFIVKGNLGKNDRFLKHAFSEEVLSITDFKEFSKEKLLHYFDVYSKDSSWGDDRADFVVLLNKFVDLIRTEKSDQFYLISKEWFEKGNEILNDSSEFYLYYFLIIWLDRDKKVVNVCEWNYD
jgi:hypothetical protein